MPVKQALPQLRSIPDQIGQEILAPPLDLIGLNTQAFPKLMKYRHLRLGEQLVRVRSNAGHWDHRPRDSLRFTQMELAAPFKGRERSEELIPLNPLVEADARLAAAIRGTHATF